MSGPSGRHAAKRRKLSAPDLAWELMDRAAEGERTWSDWARLVLARETALVLNLDDVAVARMFEGHGVGMAALRAELAERATRRIARGKQAARVGARKK